MHILLQLVRRPAFRSVVAVLVFGAFSIAGGAGAAVNGHAKKPKHLSLSNITFQETNPSGSLPVWIALEKGFFKKEGLNVSLLTVGSGASNALATVLGGSAQIGSVGAASTALAVQNGAPLRALMSINGGIFQEVLISQADANKYNIPSSITTFAAARQALLNLKGSHVTLEVNNFTGDGYTALDWEINQLGMTTGATGDINLVNAGSPANAVAVYLSGKADGLVGSPPSTVQPNSVTIPLWLYPTPSIATQEVIYTTISMIQQHPDTVQAAVNAVTEAWSYALKSPQGAVKSMIPMYVANGIPSPEEIQYLAVRNTQKLHAGTTTVITQKAFNAMSSMVNYAQPKTPITFLYAGWTVTKFAKDAIKTLGLKLPLR